MAIVGIGTDIVSLTRLRQAVARHPNITARILTADELTWCTRGTALNIESFGGFFAAKEAAAKALGTGIGAIGWRDIEIVHNEYGKPLLRWHRQALTLTHTLHVQQSWLSISHERDFAVATVVLEA